MASTARKLLRSVSIRLRNLRLAALDASHSRRGAGRRILVLRQKTHLIDYNDHFLAWAARAGSGHAAGFLFRRVPSRRPIDWDRVALVVPWVQDPVKEHHPLVYDALKSIEGICDARGIPVVNRVDALSSSIKSVAATQLAAVGIRTPRMIRITDPAAFRAAGAEQLGFPLIVREDCGHGSGIVLVRSSAELAGVPLERYQRPIAVEFIDTRGPDGLYRKYRYVSIGDGGAPRHLIVSREWEVRVRARVMAPAIKAEEVAYLDQPVRDRDTFRIAREALGLDVVSFDYSFDAQGQLIIWEANPAAILWDNKTSHAGLEHQRPAIDRLYNEMLSYYERRMTSQNVAGNATSGANKASSRPAAVLSASGGRVG
jgi:glutathione synthase/RimK-type ligase-like ATP-grasp enzyme